MLQASSHIPSYWSELSLDGVLFSLHARAIGVAAAARTDRGSSILDADEDGLTGEGHLNVEFHCRLAEEVVHSLSSPPPEVYIRLMGVFDSAGRPSKVAELALRLISGKQPLSHPMGGSWNLEDLQSVVAEAMHITNRVGVLKFTELLFEEAMVKSKGLVLCPSMADQVRPYSWSVRCHEWKQFMI